MPRTYKPKHNKSYKKYNEEVISAVLREYETSKTSFAEIGKKYNIPKSVLHRHYVRVLKKPGGQTVLSSETEEYIIKYLNICSEWGYPLDTFGLRVLVKGYLERMGIEIKKFKNNMPGPDFVNSFLKRHKNKVSRRICENIKRSRAPVTPNIIESYFAELEASLDGVPLYNIINYDETNLSDDPGNRKVITKRSVKYPECLMNHSKSSTSLMMAASADGTLLPCYVVYKSDHLYDSGIQQGPKGYDRTNSGLFDGIMFEDWVHSVAFPYFENKPGKKILIGDNFSSHLSINLIQECQEKDINFVFLPANSTHLTQPLDIAFFEPTKNAWRDILSSWKKSKGRTLATVPKSYFPVLLKKLIMRLEINATTNILAGFMEAGISPLNKNKVLERLPGNTLRLDENFNKEPIDAAAMSTLKVMHYGAVVKMSNRKEKIEVKPGQSVSIDSADTDYVDSEITQREMDLELSDEKAVCNVYRRNSSLNEESFLESIKEVICVTPGHSTVAIPQSITNAMAGPSNNIGSRLNTDATPGQSINAIIECDTSVLPVSSNEVIPELNTKNETMNSKNSNIYFKQKTEKRKSTSTKNIDVVKTEFSKQTQSKPKKKRIYESISTKLNLKPRRNSKERKNYDVDMLISWEDIEIVDIEDSM